MIEKPDKTPDDCLHLLTTDELIKLHQNRESKAGYVLGQIIMRAVIAEKIDEQNERLILIIRDCLKYLDINDETQPLQKRMISALKEHGGE